MISRIIFILGAGLLGGLSFGMEQPIYSNKQINIKALLIFITFELAWFAIWFIVTNFIEKKKGKG
jgi:hypothetical protein